MDKHRGRRAARPPSLPGPASPANPARRSKLAPASKPSSKPTKPTRPANPTNPTSPTSATSPTRRRRAPDDARGEILDAAERVFIEFAPDQVGLKEIARETGVSHALITHYFGTYANMIEAALERRVRVLRGRILEQLKVEGALARPTELIAMLFSALEDPVHLRLTRWLLASERPSSAHAFALRDRGLMLIAHQVAHAMDPQPSRQTVERVELALVTAVAAAYGYAMGKYALVGAIGREANVELDRHIQQTLSDMLQAYLRAP